MVLGSGLLTLKRIVFIIMVVAATFQYLLLVVVPHHHHGGIACMMEDICACDGYAGDEHSDHTSHHHASDDTDHSECVGETKFVLSSVDDGIKCNFTTCDHHRYHSHFLCALHLFAGFLSNEAEATTSAKPFWDDYLASHYKSIEVSQSQGLRAPPFTIS
jgi:hypothetical protein